MLRTAPLRSYFTPATRALHAVARPPSGPVPVGVGHTSRSLPRHNTAFAADVDADGSVTINDLLLLLKIFYFKQSQNGGSTSTPVAKTVPRAYVDINADQVIDILDVLEGVAAFNKAEAEAESYSASTALANEPTADSSLAGEAILGLLGTEPRLVKKK